VEQKTAVLMNITTPNIAVVMPASHIKLLQLKS